MAEARSLKQREYHTDVLSHPDHNVVNYDQKKRYNNNVRSNVFHFEPDHDNQRKQVNKREGVFKDNPLATKVARASYQDSNIFGTKTAASGTIQASETVQKKGVNERAQNTYSSAIFEGRGVPQTKERQQNTFKSGIFGDPIVENTGRKRIGGFDSGTQNLFGGESKSYEQSSANGLIQATAKKVERPAEKVFTAADLKAREVHGESALKYGTQNNKRDGGLMCAGGDWKNTGQQSTNKSGATGMNQESGLNSKDKKYQQLQSSVFGGGYEDKAPIEYERDNSKAGFGTNADWKTQGGQQKPINVGSTKVDTYLQKQKQLHSNVFGDECVTDYQGYAPMNKKGVDIDNLGVEKTTIAKGRAVDKEFKQRVSGYEQVDQNYQAGTKKQGHLASSLFDRPISNAGPVSNNRAPAAPSSYNLGGRETKATKQAFLASNDPITGQSSMGGYNKAESSKPEVIEFTLSGLGTAVDAREVKKMAGARHVVSATVDEDNMKGTCLGTGKVKVRLNQGETREQIELNFTKNGIAVREAAADPRKRPAMTGPPKEFAKEVQNTKSHKQGFLTTSNPEAFGNAGGYQVQ